MRITNNPIHGTREARVLNVARVLNYGKTSVHVHLQLGGGLGDVLFDHFILHKPRMASLLLEYREGKVKVGITYDSNNPCVKDIFGRLFPVTSPGGTPLQNWRGRPAGDIELPMDPVGLPPSYIAVLPTAGDMDRCWIDKEILRLIPNAVVIGTKSGRNGNYDPPGGGVNYFNKLSIFQQFYVLRNAKLIVSTCSYARTMSHIMRKPVIEVLEDKPDTKMAIERTRREYASRKYGMSGLNSWYIWPGQKEAFRQKMRSLYY